MTPVVYGTVDAPQIERVVVTSSYTSVDTFDNRAGLSTTSTEKLWNQSLENNYCWLSWIKNFEKAAWDFVAKGKPQFYSLCC